MHIDYSMRTNVVLVNKIIHQKTLSIMKTKILLLQIASACIILSVQAQKPASSFTISAGISSAAYTTDDENGKSYSSDFNTGACGGITLRLPTGMHWAVEPGLFYVQKGGAENVYGSDVKTA